MKKKMEFLIMSVAIIVSGCNKSTENFIDEINQLLLNKQLVSLDKNAAVEKIHIISGNGGYTLVFPKKITVDAAQIDYSESIVKINIGNDDNIVIERKLLTDQNVSGLFLLKDDAGQKRLIAVDQANVTGNLYDFKELESKLFNDPDYWQ